MIRSRSELLEMLLEHVRKMRSAQKEYFLLRSRTGLADAKSAEQQVDRLLTQIDVQASQNTE